MERVELRFIAAGMLVAWTAMAGNARAAGPDVARRVLDASGVKGGLVVHVGCGDGTLTAALRVSDSYLVQGLDADVAKARQTIRAAGVYGPVTADAWTGGRLPYANNVVNLLLVTEPNVKIANDEMLRVLVPEGVAVIGDQRIVKPRPKNVDDWTHYLHDASNNAVSHDTAVGPPRRAQWVSDPLWSRNHEKMSSFSVMVSAKGRVFLIADHQSPASMAFPPVWKLSARDAYNGVLLWEIPMPEWWPTMFGFKAGPTNLTRRLVAVGDRVFVTLGIRSPLSVLDAASGKTLATWDRTKDAEEVIVDGSTAFVTGHDPAAYPKIATFAKSGDFSLWDTGPRWLKAIDVATGKVIWEHAGTMTPRSVAADASRVYYHDGERIVALDRAGGREQWKSDPAPLTKTPVSSFGPNLVVVDDVVLFSGGAEKRPKGSAGQNTMYAYSAQTGKTIWNAVHPDTGHESPKDLLVVGGKVWLAETNSPKSRAEFVGRDLHSGQIKTQFAPDVKAQWFHHRCYPAKATDNFIITSRKGVEFVDLANKHWQANHWVRGACIFGVLPANGLLYAPPQPCGCMPETKLTGLWALSPASPEEPDAAKTERLERGPAFADSPPAQAPDPQSEDWPTYRHDAQRSGATAAAVPTALRPAWQTMLGGKLSAASVAGGKLFVARVNEQEVCALDAASGAVAWRFTAGGRMTTPPTIAAGRALIACADGFVYCLRADDGRLIWRFRVAPAERRIVARDQVESAWPVHGSVLVKDGVAYAVAGRSMFLDGGMRLVRLDIATGKLVSEEVLNETDPATGKPLQDYLTGMNMPVSVPDILSADDKHLYMMSQTFSLDGKRTRVAPYGGSGESGPGKPTPADEVHLFSAYNGMLDESWHTRSYWIFGTWMSGGSGGWYQAGQRQPAGRMMVFDRDQVYAYGRKPGYFGWTTAIEYRLFAAPKVPEVKPYDGVKDGYSPKQTFATNWVSEVPLHARALVKTKDALFLAGPPDVLDEGPKKQYGNVPESKDALDAWEGRKGAELWAVSASDGKKIAAIKLDSPPVFDGMAAARGRLFLVTMDGAVRCFDEAR